MEKDNKSVALDYIKSYYEKFLINYTATEPERVNAVKYFTDWLETATPDCIDVEEVKFFIRKCDLEAQLTYFYRINSDCLSSDRYSDVYLTVYVVSDELMPYYIGDCFYSTEADKKIVPGCIKQIVKEQGTRIIDREYHINAVVRDNGVRLTKCDISDPEEDVYLKCIINYPHPIADKEGKNIRQLQFIIYNDKMFKTHEPDKVNEKPISERKAGCYVATAVYSSYDCPEVWTLRRYRDETLGSTRRGRAFIRLYYAISPTLVKWFGDKKWFKRMWKGRLDKMVKRLNENGVKNTPYTDKDWN